MDFACGCHCVINIRLSTRGESFRAPPPLVFRFRFERFLYVLTISQNI